MKTKEQIRITSNNSKKASPFQFKKSQFCEVYGYKNG
jgi:hypothetical protein